MPMGHHTEESTTPESGAQRPRVRAEFFTERQGRKFVLYAGLLDAAHAEGLRRIETELIQVPTEANGNVAIVRAVVETDRGVFTGLGDAAPNNVARPMVTCLIRFAETRSKARALRDAINVGVAALEELDGDDDPPAPAPRPAPVPRPGGAPPPAARVAPTCTAKSPETGELCGRPAETEAALVSEARSYGQTAPLCRGHLLRVVKAGREKAAAGAGR